MQGAKKQRTCMTCGKQDSKHALYRLVRDKEGYVSVDGSAKVPGRGAYICSEKCLADALSSKRCERALRTKIDLSDNDRIVAEFEALMRNGREKF